MAGAKGPRRSTQELSPALRELPKRWKEAREEAGLGANELDRLLRQGSGYTSRMEMGEKPHPYPVLVERAARALRVRKGWLLYGELPKRLPEELEGALSLPARAFLSRLLRLPRLQETVEIGNPQWTVWDLVAVVADVIRDPSAVGRTGDPVRRSWEELLNEKGSLELVDGKRAARGMAEAKKKEAALREQLAQLDAEFGTTPKPPKRA